MAVMMKLGLISIQLFHFATRGLTCGYADGFGGM